MSIANNTDYGVLSRIHAPLEQPSELEVMLMSTVSALPQGDESFEQGGQRGAKKMPRVKGQPKNRLVTPCTVSREVDLHIFGA